MQSVGSWNSTTETHLIPKDFSALIFHRDESTWYFYTLIRGNDILLNTFSSYQQPTCLTLFLPGEGGISPLIVCHVTPPGRNRVKAAPVLTHMEPEGWACGRHKLPRCRSFLFYPNYCNNLVLLNSNHRPWHTAARILFLSTAHVLKRFPFYVINPNFFIITFVIATRGSKGWCSSS